MGRHKEKLETKNKYTERELCWLADQLYEGKSNADTAEAFRIKFKKPFGVRHLSGVVRRNGGSKTAFIEKNVSEQYKREMLEQVAQQSKAVRVDKPVRRLQKTPTKPGSSLVFVPEEGDRPYIRAVEEYLAAMHSSGKEKQCKWIDIGKSSSCEDLQSPGSVYCTKHEKVAHNVPPQEKQERRKKYAS